MAVLADGQCNGDECEMRDIGECAVGGESYPCDAEVPAAEEAGGMIDVTETCQGDVLRASASADAAIAKDVTTCGRCDNAADAVNDAESDSLDHYVTVKEDDRTFAAKLDVGPAAGSCLLLSPTLLFLLTIPIMFVRIYRYLLLLPLYLLMVTPIP